MSFRSYMIYTLDYYQNRVSFIPMFIVGNKTNIFFLFFFWFDSKVDSAVHTSEVDKMGTRNIGEVSGKK